MNSWQTIAKNLPQGQSARVECNNCGIGTGATAAICNHNAKAYTVHCFACDHHEFESKGVLSLDERKRINDLNEEAYASSNTTGPITLPEDTTYEPTEFSREARMWLFKAGITPTTWRKYGIGYSKRLERVVLPVFSTSGDLIWYQCRAILTGQKPKYLQPSRDKNNVYYDSGTPESSGRVIVVEDILSYIRVNEAGDNDVFTPLGTKLSSGQANALSKYDRITTWLDGDRAGRDGAKNIKRTMSLLCEVDNIRTDEDPKCYSNKQIREILQ